MKIVHTESSLGWGGQEIRILRESQKLALSGHDVTVLCDGASTIAARQSEWAPSIKCIGTKLSKKRPKDLVRLRSALIQLSPDIVICHSSTDHWLTAVARLSLRRKFPIVRTRHISAPVGQNLATRWLYRRGCEFVITTGDSIKEALVDNGLCPADKVSSIPTGLDPSKFTTRSREDARRALGLPCDDLLVGIVATLRSWKGHEDLIRALVEINPAVKLLIVGEGPRLQALQGLSFTLGLADRVRFVGQQTDVAPWFAALDVYAQPSYANEGVPQAILQAMATGLPIVSCPTGGIPEAMVGYQAGTMVPIHSPTQLAEAIECSIARLPTLPDRRALSHVPFSEDDMTSRCAQTYQRIFDEFHDRRSH
jgi:glycosyltransferase involved in cell wall biosynthesis